MAFNDGDFVKVEYSAWRAADGKLIHTTSRKLAQENDILDEDANYASQLVIIGKQSVVKGLENAIRSMSLNETKKVELEPKDAFGDKNPQLVKVMSMGDFRKRDINPYPGMQLELDNSVATVKSVSSGRVVVDANHPLAGEKLTYEIKVVEKVDNDDDRVKAIAEMLSLKPDSILVNDRKVSIKFGESVEKNSKYLVSKSELVDAILAYMEKIETVEVDEEYARKKETKTGDKAAK